jgi:hypothetical protein
MKTEVAGVISQERQYQDDKWPQNPPLPPSDELRLIRIICEQADKNWYTTQDRIVDGTKVNPADLDAMRKIAAVAVRCMETWGVEHRQA